VTQPPRVLEHALSLSCFHGRPHWVALSPVRGGCSDTCFYGSRWSSRLEVSEPDARSLLPTSGAEVTPSHALEIVPADPPSSSHASALPALGLPLFLSNLQVSQLFALLLFILVNYIFCLSVHNHRILLRVYPPN
jgi:hypothetical protein